jgi:uncharacterized protein with FMN-binding domain
MKKRSTPGVLDGPQAGIRKLVVSVAIVGAFALYSIMHARSNLGAPALGSSGDVGSPASTATATAPSDATAAPGSRYRDGAFTGSEADAQWGYVQVQAVVQAGKIADVKFLDFPHDRTRSQLINQYADPQLVSEAIQVQSAQVDIITGATDTSFAFMQSLADALAKAQA